MNTTYFLNLLAGNVFRSKLTPALPETLYIGLSTTEPSIDGSGMTEPADSVYNRILLSEMGEPVGGMTVNTAVLDFPESVGNWGVITHFGIFDAGTGGNLLMYGALERPRTIEPETVMSFKPGMLKLSMKNPEEQTENET